MWAFNFHSAPNGAGYVKVGGYKHIAPPEQEPSIPMIATFVQSSIDR